MAKNVGRTTVIAGIIASLLALAQGCKSTREEAATPESTRQTVEAAKLALKFTPGQTTTYKVTTEAEKSVEWQGNTSNKPTSFRGGRTGHHIEMTFEQQVQRVDDQGHATLKITIKALKYLGRRRETVALDFDSSRPADQSSPFAKLIGQSYGLEMSPQGEVLAVTDVEPARGALQGNSPEQQTALKLLDEPIIKTRHEISALMALPAEAARSGQRWSDVKSFAFGMMGAASFERVYTLETLADADGAGVAVVTMSAIPSSALAQEQHAAQPSNVLDQMFDSTESYEGRLELSLDTGEIVEYTEQLHMQWVAADPTAAESGVANPAVLNMGATQRYRLDRVK